MPILLYKQTVSTIS